MRRFFIEHLDPAQESLSITGSEATHITKVLRMRTGDSFVLMDAEGTRCMVSVESAGTKEVRVRVLRKVRTPPPSPVEIVLCQSLLKSRHMDYLVEKASELGADRLIPFASERTVVRLEADRVTDKLRHWGRISRSSATQSGRGTPALIDPPVSFGELMDRWQGEHAAKVILWEEEAARDLKGVLATPEKRFVGVVGPEGGFEAHEVHLAKRSGFVPVSLGQRILRAETAAITLAALVQFAWGDLGVTATNEP